MQFKWMHAASIPYSCLSRDSHTFCTTCCLIRAAAMSRVTTHELALRLLTRLYATVSLRFLSKYTMIIVKSSFSSGSLFSMSSVNNCRLGPYGTYTVPVLSVYRTYEYRLYSFIIVWRADRLSVIGAVMAVDHRATHDDEAALSRLRDSGLYGTYLTTYLESCCRV